MSHPIHARRSARRCATGLLLAALALPAGAAQVSFAHLAPGAGTVQWQLDDGAADRLDYRQFGPLRTAAEGPHRIRALRGSDGALLAEATLTLGRDDRQFVLLAGNGSEIAPFELRRSTDHNHPLFIGQRSMQQGSVAIVPAASGDPRGRPLYTQVECPGRLSPNASPERYGEGSVPLEAEGFGAGGLQVGPAGGRCTERLTDGRDTVYDEIPLDARGGDRQRRFVIGDGVHEPYELLLLTQGREPEMLAVGPDASAEGLWYPVGLPAGTGLQLSYDAAAPEGRRLSALFFGYDEEDTSHWNVLVPPSTLPAAGRLDMIEYRGDPDGTRAAIGFQVDQAVIVIHSCEEMTLMGSFALRSRLIPEWPRDAIRFRKLFPPGCAAAPARK